MKKFKVLVIRPVAGQQKVVIEVTERSETRAKAIAEYRAIQDDHDWQDDYSGQNAKIKSKVIGAEEIEK